MRKERQRGLAIAGGIVALAALAAACMGKPDLPPFVQSGNLSGDGVSGGGGGETTPVDAGTGDAGIDDEAGTGVPLSSGEACALPNGTCEEAAAVSPTAPPTCPSTIATTCPNTGVVGCCTVPDTSGNTIQTCYYTGSTAGPSTSAGCAAVMGSFGAAPLF